MFQPGRVRFAQDLVRNQRKTSVRSRYSMSFGQPVVETDVKVRSLLARSAEVQP
jgi:phosphatidylserine decarboxylase